MAANRPLNPNNRTIDSISDLREHSLFVAKDAKDAKTEAYGISPSCPDVRAAFKDVDQTQWVNFSKNTIDEFRKRLPEFKNFHEAYDFLRLKRKEATAFDSRDTEEVKDYGEPRPRYGGHPVEDIFPNREGTQPWENQKIKIEELAYQLLTEAKAAEKNGTYSIAETPDYSFSINQYGTVEIPDSDGNAVSVGATSYNITIKSPKFEGLDDKFDSPFDSYQKRLGTIEISECDEKKYNRIRLHYAGFPPTLGDNELADRYYKELLEWKKEEGVEKFMITAGKLTHLEAHLLPAKRGSAAILEWMIRGIAAEKGVNLGSFNHEEGISWDLKALLTPNRDKYAEWYAKKAFTSIELSPDPNLSAELRA